MPPNRRSWGSRSVELTRFRGHPKSWGSDPRNGSPHAAQQSVPG